MAQNPNPLLPITSYKGVTRTLDDWATVFNIALIVLPDRPEASAFVPVVDRIFATFGDSDVRTIVCVPSTPAITKRILGDAVDRWLMWCDPDRALVDSLGLERLPAFLHAAPGHAARHGGAGLEPDGVAAGRRRDRAQRALDVTDRGQTRRSRPHTGLAGRELTRSATRTRARTGDRLGAPSRVARRCCG